MSRTGRQIPSTCPRPPQGKSTGRERQEEGRSPSTASHKHQGREEQREEKQGGRERDTGVKRSMRN